MNTRMQTSAPRRTDTGFTIVELLIAVIIIGILVAIIVPIYVSRADDARLTAAKADLDALATAQQHAAIDTGYYYRLFMLDDVQGGDNIAPSNLTNDVVDGVRDEILRTDANNLPQFFIDTKFGNLITPGAAIYNRMVQNETEFNWNGPYVTVARKAGAKFGTPGNVPATTPLDPWGSPYLFFTRLGVVQEPDGLVSSSFVDVINGGSYDAQVFDRPTMLSLGPNRLPGDGAGSALGTGDDIIKQF